MNKEFTICPHKGYLNTSFCFCSKHGDCVIVDDFDMSEIALVDGVTKNVRLQPGVHKFSTKSGSCCEEIVVEDALKFGGSTIKYTFCSDISPWVVFVMKDRMYLHNSLTKEEYVENGISPDSICAVNEKYLIFQSNHATINTLYSCDERKEVDKFDHIIYNADGILIFSRNVNNFLEVGHYRIARDGHILGSLEKCSEYSLYKHRIYLRGINNEYLKTPFENPIATSFNPIDDHTLCLVNDSPYALVGETCKNGFAVKIIDVRDRSIYAIHSLNEYVESINSHSVMSLEEIDNLFDKAKEICNTYPNVLQIRKTYSVLNYFLWSDAVLCLKVTINETSNSKKGITTSYKTQLITMHNMHVIYETSCLIELHHIYQSYKRLYIQENSSILSIIEFDSLSVVQKNDSKIYSYKDSFLLVERVECQTFIYKEDESLLLETNHKLDFNLLKYGIICDNTDDVFLHLNSGKEGFQRIKYVSYLQKEDWLICRVKDRGVVFISSHYDHLLKCPFNIEFISCCCSRNGNTLVGFENGLPHIYKYINDSYHFVSRPWENLFDRSQYSNGWFDETGNCFIYDSKERLYKYYNYLTDCIEIFEDPYYITRNDNYGINSYHPLIEFNKKRIPVFKDPYTLQSINNKDLNKLAFISPDGQYIVESDFLTKHEDKISRKEISQKDFLKLTILYNCANSPNAEIIENRKSFIQEHKPYFERYKTIEQIINYTSNFTKYFINNQKFILLHDIKNGNILYFEISADMNFLNYVSFSFNSKYMAIAGLAGSNGIVEIFEIATKERIYYNTTNRAVWLVSFDKNDNIAYYTSTPDSNIIPLEEFTSDKRNYDKFSHPHRSFLTFSPSGKYFALSKQGYTSFESDPENWGHNPSCDIYIHMMSNPDICLAHYNDHGDGIVGVSAKAKSVAAVAFSRDESRLLSVSNDGVVVVRNLLKRLNNESIVNVRSSKDV